jgi:polyhydroxybutyrate depolymerase
MKYFIPVAMAACLLAANISNAQNQVTPGQSKGQITVDGMPRSFIVYIPKSYSTAGKAPVIFLFHGGGATASSMLNISNNTDFKSLSEQENIVLVAPEGVDKSWNDGRGTKANKKDVDDVKFVTQLSQYIQSNYSIDTTRIYATGISNGGFMVSRLGCDLGWRFAAVAVVAATMGEDVPYSTCSPGVPLPVMYIHGTADPIIPFNGAKKSIGAEGAFVSHQQVIDKWVSINKSSSTPETTQLPDIAMDGTSITEEKYPAGKNGAEVISYTVNDGGHTWPGGKQYLPKLLIGRVSRDMNACEVIWDFFRQHKR